MDQVEARRRLINLENTLARLSLTFSSVRDPAVEQARFPNMVATYWGLVDRNGCPPSQRDFAQAVANDPSIQSLPRPAVLARGAGAPLARAAAPLRIPPSGTVPVGLPGRRAGSRGHGLSHPA
ncbi:MAG: hypothetical protein IT307_01485 [Chloroflexi bacterium]|nr:hypothetical protein [Chloroflexota bacterium]